MGRPDGSGDAGAPLARGRPAVGSIDGGGGASIDESSSASCRRTGDSAVRSISHTRSGTDPRREDVTMPRTFPRVALFTDSYYEANGVARTAGALEAHAARFERPMLVVHGGYANQMLET